MENNENNLELLVNELNESLGNLRQAGASAEYITIIKAALKQKAVRSISPNSKVIAIEGSSFEEFVADLRAAKKSGEFGLVYIGTASGTHVIVNQEPGFSDKPVGLNTDVATLTLDKHPVTGDDMLSVYAGSGWRSSYRAQKVKDLKLRLDIAPEGYKGFIILKDPTLFNLRNSRELNKRVTDKYAPNEGTWNRQDGESDFYAEAKKQAIINRSAKANIFPAVDKMTWDDFRRLDEIAKRWSTESVATIGGVVYTSVRGDFGKPTYNGDYWVLFRLVDEDDKSFSIRMNLKGVYLA